MGVARVIAMAHDSLPHAKLCYFAKLHCFFFGINFINPEPPFPLYRYLQQCFGDRTLQIN